jgi:hypothetical protein
MVRRAATQAERDAKVRLLLRTVIETAQEAAQLLREPYGIPSDEIDD